MTRGCGRRARGACRAECPRQSRQACRPDSVHGRSPACWRTHAARPGAVHPGCRRVRTGAGDTGGGGSPTRPTRPPPTGCAAPHTDQRGPPLRSGCAGAHHHDPVPDQPVRPFSLRPRGPTPCHGVKGRTPTHPPRLRTHGLSPRCFIPRKRDVQGAAGCAAAHPHRQLEVGLRG